MSVVMGGGYPCQGVGLACFVLGGGCRVGSWVDSLLHGAQLNGGELRGCGFG